ELRSARLPERIEARLVVRGDLISLDLDVRVAVAAADAELTVGENMIVSHLHRGPERKASAMIQTDHVRGHGPAAAAGAINGARLRRARVFFDGQPGDGHARGTARDCGIGHARLYPVSRRI